MSKESELRRIKASFDLFELCDEHRNLIMEAIDSDLWSWYDDSDGCTGVSELYWPTRYFPPCVRHDYDFMIGNGGVEGSKTFYVLQRAYGMSRTRSALRVLGVSVAWCAWFRRFGKRKIRL